MGLADGSKVNAAEGSQQGQLLLCKGRGVVKGS